MAAQFAHSNATRSPNRERFLIVQTAAFTITPSVMNSSLGRCSRAWDFGGNLLLFWSRDGKAEGETGAFAGKIFGGEFALTDGRDLAGDD